MKFTLSWLKEHLDTTAPVAEITEVLTDLGLEVEGVENRLDALKEFTLGRVLSATKHPDADRLTVCQVLTDRGTKQIVCGAPNARAGITAVIAHPGTYIPGIDTTIQVGKIRGVESHGMMCSEREMLLSDEHDGIIELASGEVGENFTDWLAANDPARIDPVIEIAITPNRQDALGVEGIARDLAARGLGTLIENPVQPVQGQFPCPINVTIDDDTKGGCPMFTGRLIKGITNRPSPDWLQTRLRAIGLRPISALVDITNFFTFDRNRPLHVFDAGLVKGDLRVHRAKGGEEIAALDDKTYRVAVGMMLISDASGPQSIAGCVGGAATGVTSDTVNVFVESAFWDPVTIASTARRLKVSSDAKYRFERGVDPEFTLPGLEAATTMILDLCGGEASTVVVAGAVPDWRRAYRLDAARVESLVGMDIPEATQRQTLTALGFEMKGDMAHVPPWRSDVKGEADLAEEVARIASLTKLKGRPVPRMTPGVPRPILTRMQRRESAARRATSAQGMNECVTYSFIDEALARLFGGGGDATRLENPISSEMSHLRPSLLPGLLQAAARNQARGFADLALFEVGQAFSGGEPGDQHLLAAGIRVGQSDPRSPHAARRGVDLYDAKADLKAVLAAVGAPTPAQIRRDGADCWHPGRHGVLALGKVQIAIFGEAHPRIVQALGLKGPVVGFVANLDAIPFPRARGTTRPALELLDLQAVERDFAFVVDADIEADRVVNAALGADKALIETVKVFDEFTGDKAEVQMGEGKKSLAISVRLQPTEKTLTDRDISTVSARIVEKVGKATGGVLRG